jgi:hypothetical protein
MSPIIVALLAISLLAALLLWLLHRSERWSGLIPALALSGITGAVLTSCYVLTTATAPIAPYEPRASAWLSLAGPLALGLCVGFGIGVFVGAAAGLPYWYLSGRSKSGVH